MKKNILNPSTNLKIKNIYHVILWLIFFSLMAKFCNGQISQCNWARGSGVTNDDYPKDVEIDFHSAGIYFTD